MSSQSNQSFTGTQLTRSSGDLRLLLRGRRWTGRRAHEGRSDVTQYNNVTSVSAVLYNHSPAPIAQVSSTASRFKRMSESSTSLSLLRCRLRNWCGGCHISSAYFVSMITPCSLQQHELSIARLTSTLWPSRTRISRSVTTARARCR